MRNQIIEDFEKRNLKDVQTLPAFKSGDTVRVHYKIREKGSEKVRIQQFEGVVIRYKKGLSSGAFTVRKIGAGGIGVERVFPLYSPNISKVEVRAKGIVRRSRLFYLRDLSGKAARIKNKFGGILSKNESSVDATTSVETSTSAEN